jgi:periplasmic divalent cation tolerance protein
MSAKYYLIYCTCPDQAIATELAQQLIAMKVAACINILPNLTSIYNWEGQIETATESLLMIKTTIERYSELETLILQLHPYQVPEIIATPIEKALPNYLNWIDQCLIRV